MEQKAASTARVLIKGNTYPVKDQLRALGGVWNPQEKGWEVPAAKAGMAHALVGKAPVSRGQSKSRAGCACSDGCCDRGCRCGMQCNCRGGPIWDC